MKEYVISNWIEGQVTTYFNYADELVTDELDAAVYDGEDAIEALDGVKEEYPGAHLREITGYHFEIISDESLEKLRRG